MNESTAIRLATLRQDYRSVTGVQFSHFYCPILFRDEDVDLCQAHLINQSFRRSPRTWTIQRKDVDCFFGSVFEADFVKLQHQNRYSPDEILVNRSLAKQLHPRIEIGGNRVDYYTPRGPVPKEHISAEFRLPSGSVTLGIKLRPEDALKLSPESLQIVIERDLRISALVSLIKSAHLTLFDLLGYRWALSAAGRFVGYDVLGNFFQNHATDTRQEILAASLSHFAEFANMVRPVLSQNTTLRGTISDKVMLLCKESNGGPWGIIVLIPIGRTLHAVLLPLFEEMWAVKRYLDFLGDDVEQIAVVLVRFRDEKWLASREESFTIRWPKPARLLEGGAS